jgi:hypothetical protein
MIIRSGLIGIDVSKAHFDIFDAESGRTERHPNSGESARSFADRLQSRPQAFAIFEATGPVEGAFLAVHREEILPEKFTERGEAVSNGSA